jgi:hypothetical protein
MQGKRSFSATKATSAERSVSVSGLSLDSYLAVQYTLIAQSVIAIGVAVAVSRASRSNLPANARAIQRTDGLVTMVISELPRINCITCSIAVGRLQVHGFQL